MSIADLATFIDQWLYLSPALTAGCWYLQQQGCPKHPGMTGGMVTPGSWVITNSRQVRRRINGMQAMGKCPQAGGQQTYDFATMYAQLKLCADPPADPNDPQYIAVTVRPRVRMSWSFEC